jgi:hypothetical protein
VVGIYGIYTCSGSLFVGDAGIIEQVEKTKIGNLGLRYQLSSYIFVLTLVYTLMLQLTEARKKIIFKLLLILFYRF